ncbi:MAG: ATP phosphoribosyltransferase regulatory subunit [Bacillota bacterium]|nr:ATP phosphoribosyltransferase regulatory subunit [Bacillota bacterium]
MGQWQFHTPDGVADLLPRDCAAKRQLEQRLRVLFSQRGYLEIETPGIEFYDVYAAGSGTVPQEGLFKFFDQQGRILCLRYDGTVPAARVAATLCREYPVPLRLSYIGNMYRYNEFGGGRQREFSQAGIELLGSNSPEADAEVIATAIAAALAVGVEDLQVSVGQVAFFHGVLAEWRIEGEEAELLPHLIDTKQLVAIEELAERLSLPDKARRVITKLASSYGTEEDINELEGLVSHPVALAALQNLREVLHILADDDCLRYVSVDLGMLQSINYYTGIIFKGFTYGLGFPLFSGGRYDSLIQTFGRNLAATGFSIGLSLAQAALQRQGKAMKDAAPPVWIGYAAGQRPVALRLAEKLRREGKAVICDCDHLSPADLSQRQAGPIVIIDEKGSAQWIREDI